MVKISILSALGLELLFTFIGFHLSLGYPTAYHVVMLILITIVSTCFGIGIYHTLKEDGRV